MRVLRSGASLGVIAGLAAGTTPGVRNFFDPLVSFLYPIPKITFLSGVPPAVRPRQRLADRHHSFGVFFPVFVASRHSVLSVNRLFVWAGQNMGARRTTVFFRVVLPAAAPMLFSGLRVGLAHSFVVLFAAELIGARNGLGTSSSMAKRRCGSISCWPPSRRSR